METRRFFVTFFELIFQQSLYEVIPTTRNINLNTSMFNLLISQANFGSFRPITILACDHFAPYCNNYSPDLDII